VSDQQVDVSTQTDAHAAAQADAHAATQPRARDMRDRFDEIPKRRRVGAHRITTKIRRFWQFFIAAVIGVAVLTGAGVLFVNSLGQDVTQLFDRGNNTDTPTEPTVTPKLDPEVPVAVLNGTTTPGLQETVVAAITEGEWGSVVFADVAAADDVQISAVFYSSAADEPAALALAQKLGGVSVYESADYAQYGAHIGVLLGADYAGPGSDTMTGADPQSNTDTAPEGDSNATPAAAQ